MVWVGAIENRVTQHHKRFLITAGEKPCQRTVLCLDHSALSHPLPKLLLCRPELILVVTHNQRRMLFLAFFLSLHNLARLLLPPGTLRAFPCLSASLEPDIWLAGSVRQNTADTFR